MGRSFTIEYDDFSGGYYVGTNETQQPKNTWTGTDVAVSPSTGHLLPLVAGQDSGSLPSGVAVVGSFGMASNDIAFWGTTNTTGTIYYGNWSLTTSGSAGATSLITTGPVQFAGKMCWSRTAIGNGYVSAVDVNSFALTSGLVSAGSYLRVIGTYKYWMVGADSVLTNRMRYSAPNDPVTWAAADYIDIGSTSNAITGFVDMLDTLYVLTTGGLYAISGVLGATATLRQVNRIPLSDGAPFETTILGVTSNVTASQYDGPIIMSGSTGRRVLQGVSNATGVVQVGSMVVVSNSDGSFFINDPANSRAWYRRSSSTLNGTILPSTINRSEYLYTYTGSTGPQKIKRVAANPTTAALDPTSAVFPSRSVTLADYQANQQFVVDKITAEVVVGESSSAPRAIGVQMGTLSVPVGYSTNPTQFSGATSQAQSYGFTSTSTGSMMAVDFTPNDAGPTYNVAPIITLQGVELRRLIVRCHEVG
jgi:hypothetical protein